MRAITATITILLATSALPALSAAPAEAAACADATTTWEPTGSDGDSWGVDANWTAGVPTASSVVCIPGAARPRVPEYVEASAARIDAADGGITVEGDLTVGQSLEAADLDLAGGELHGGVTTVTGHLSASGDSSTDGATMVSDGTAELGRFAVWDAPLTLAGSARIDDSVLIGGAAGLVEVAATGDVALEGGASVSGPFLNRGTVRAVAGEVIVGADEHPSVPSTGTFVAEPGAAFWVADLRLGDGAVMRGITLAGSTTIAEDATVTLDAAQLGTESHQSDITGHGRLRALNGSGGDGQIRDQVDLVVPDGEVFHAGEVTLAEQARATVAGVLRDDGGLAIVDRARMQVSGVHRISSSSVADARDVLPRGTEVIGRHGRLEVPASGSADLNSRLVNRGTVRVGRGGHLNTPGDLSNAGRVELSPRARLAVDGRYQQEPAGRLLTVVGREGHGVLAATGTRQLGGTLGIRRAAGYRPSVGSRFLVVRASGGSSRFSALSGGAFGGTRKFEPTYLDDGRVRLRVVRRG